MPSLFDPLLTSSFVQIKAINKATSQADEAILGPTQGWHEWKFVCLLLLTTKQWMASLFDRPTLTNFVQGKIINKATSQADGILGPNTRMAREWKFVCLLSLHRMNIINHHLTWSDHFEVRSTHTVHTHMKGRSNDSNSYLILKLLFNKTFFGCHMT
jgi:hypothetical protein